MGMGMVKYCGITAGTVIRSKSVTMVIAGTGAVHAVISRETGESKKFCTTEQTSND